MNPLPDLATNERQVQLFRENTRRLREYNHDLAMVAYYRLADTKEPVRPRLLDLNGEERDYEPSPVAPLREGTLQHPWPVGGGPDRYGYWQVIEPDAHPMGAILQTADGSVWFKAETPVFEGGMEPRWVKVS
jgi:hypothetical protein